MWAIFFKNLCVRYNAWVGRLLWWSCQSPVSHSCGLLNHPNHFCKGTFKLMKNLMQIHCSTHSVILNEMSTQYTCSLKSVYWPHWLVQWSHHCSCMFIPVHSAWLQVYIDVMQAVLLMLTMAGHFSRHTSYILNVCYFYINYTSIKLKIKSKCNS